MAELVYSNNSLLLKLSATSFAISTAVTKLYSNYKEKQMELQKDLEFLNSLKLAYIESSDEEQSYADDFAAISAEADKLLLELNSLNG